MSTNVSETKTQLELFHISWPLFLVIFAIVLLAAYMNVIPGGIIGALAVTITLGAVLNEIGNKAPIIKTYFGGGPIIAIFGASALVFFGILNERTIGIVDTFMRGGGFLDFVIAALITGSILGMNRGLLIKAFFGFIPAILGGVIVALGFAFVVGAISGFGGMEAIMFIAIPIVGGGMGAGAVPLSQIFYAQTGVPAETALAMMVPAVALGNAIAIIAAALLNAIAEKRPGISGNGQLVKGFDFSEDGGPSVRDIPMTIKNLGIGLLVSLAFFCVGTILGGLVPAIHAYAWMIIAVGIAKVAGIMPLEMEAACSQWYQFNIMHFVNVILVGIGIAFTDLNDVIAALSPSYLLIVTVTIVGVILGAGIVGSLLRFYFLEIAVTAGLCMANMGGTGDVAVLSACKRMELMPFAQVSSRIGGAIMLLVASLFLGIVNVGGI